MRGPSEETTTRSTSVTSNCFRVVRGLEIVDRAFGADYLVGLELFDTSRCLATGYGVSFSVTCFQLLHTVRRVLDKLPDPFRERF